MPIQKSNNNCTISYNVKIIELFSQKNFKLVKNIFLLEYIWYKTELLVTFFPIKRGLICQHSIFVREPTNLVQNLFHSRGCLVLMVLQSFLQCVSTIYSSWICSWWLDFVCFSNLCNKLKPIFAAAPVSSQYNAHYESGQNWLKNNHLETLI